QEDHGREERRGGQVGDAEALADQVARGLQLGLETVERPEHLLAAARRACIVDLHVSPHHDPEGGEEGAVEATSARPEAEREGGGRELGLRQARVEERAAYVGDALPVERPARLLVEVREAELPEDGRGHHPTTSARRSGESRRVATRVAPA